MSPLASSSLANEHDSRKSTSLEVWLVALVCLAHFPFLWDHLHNLWKREHYQFYPVVLLAVAWLAWTRWQDEKLEGSTPLAKLFYRPWVTPTLLSASASILAIAVILYSPWIGMISWWLAMGCLAITLARLGALRHSLGIWLLLLLLIPPPLNWDQRLINELQLLSTRLSSAFLDFLGAEHLALGNVIELPQKELFVDEACGGIMSLIAMLASGAIIAVALRRSLAHSIILILSGILWAGMMNVFRLVLITFVLNRYQVDLTTGWQHEALGFILYCLAFIGMLSTDQLLLGVLTQIPSAQREDIENPLIQTMNRLSGSGNEPIGDKAKTENERGTSFARPLFLAFLSIFTVLFIGQIIAMTRSTSGQLRPQAKLQRNSLTAPAGWTLAKYEQVARSANSLYGEFSDIWTFENDEDTQIRAALDYPFPWFHNLSYCYQSRGWLTKALPTLEIKDLNVLRFRLSKPTGENAILLFASFDEAGNNRTPLSSNPNSSFRERLFGMDRRKLPKPRAMFQFQILLECDGPMDPRWEAKVDTVFPRLYEEIRAHFAQQPASTETPDVPPPNAVSTHNTKKP